MYANSLSRMVGLAALVVLELAATGWASTPLESLFPSTTRGFLAVRNVQELREHFEKTQIGQLLKDPALQPFVEDLRQQIQERLSGSREQLGITAEDVAQIATGEVAVGVIHKEGEEEAGLAAVITITGERQKAQDLINRIVDDVKKRGGSTEKITIRGEEVLAITMPKRPDGTTGGKVFCCLQNDLLITASNQAAIESILTLQKQKGNSLTEVKGFSAIMDRCRRDLPDGEEPQIRWFVDPFGYAEAIRTTIPPERRKQRRLQLERLKAAGFSVFQGIGGFVSFSTEGFELIHRTFVYAPPPREKSAKMFDFPNGEAFQVPKFIPRDLATIGMGYCNLLTGFDNIGPVFDQVIGEGEEGVWDEVLAGLKDDPQGPQIDLRNELFAHFGEKVAIFTAYRLPITTTSERILIAIEVKDEQATEKGIAKVFANDKHFREREHKGKVIWERKPPETRAVPRIELGGVPGLAQPEPSESEETEPLFPNTSVTVHQGYLLIASHFDYLTEILDLQSERETIVRNPDFLEVMETIEKLGGKKACWRGFSLTDEEYRPTYELIRQGKMPESETMLGRILNTIFAPPEKGALRKQRIDGSKLPDYEVVRRHLGPAGVFAVTENDGWFIKGFTLPKK